MDRRTYLKGFPILATGGCLTSGEAGPPGGSNPAASSSGPQRVSAGTFDRFEDLSSWRPLNGSLRADAERSFTGSQSAHLSIATSERRGWLAREFDPPVDLRGLHPQLAVRADRFVAPRVQAYDVAGDRVDFRTVVKGGLRFRTYDFGIEHVEGTPDLSAVSELRIQEYTGSDRAAELWFDGLRFVERPDGGRVLVQFDDGYVTDYTRAFPVLDRHGFRATTFVNPGNVGRDDILSLEQLRELQAAGWEVANHTLDHDRLSELDPDRQAAQVREAKEWLVDHGFERGAAYFAYPFSALDQTTVDVVERHHRLAFTGGGGYPALGSVSNVHLIQRAAGQPSAKEARRAIDRTAEWGGVTTLFYHELSGDVISAFERTVEYLHERASAGDVEVVTVSEIEDALA